MTLEARISNSQGGPPQAAEPAISLANVSKCYRIWRDPAARLKHPLLELIARTLPVALQPNALRRRVSPTHQSGYYRDFFALESLDLEVKRGEVLGIIGRNGSGKSTLLQIIAGTLQPTAGEILVGGRVGALLELGSGFNPDFTGRENVYLNASILGLAKEEVDERFDEIVRFAEIGDFLDQPVKTYSSGMAVRLAFAVVAHIDPEILIIDEALAVGDAVFQSKCYRRFREIRERGTTVILVTHDTSAIVQVCDRAIILERGKLVASGHPKAMSDEYKRRCAIETTPSLASARSEVPLRRHVEESSRWLQRLPTVQEYGDGTASILNFAILAGPGKNPTTRIASGERVALRMLIRFERACREPIASFGIRDLAGNELLGTNTWYEESPIGPTVPGTMVEVDFEFEVGLRAGLANLCLACTEMTDAGLVVYHRLYDVVVLEISATRRFTGVWDVRPTVVIRRE